MIKRGKVYRMKLNVFILKNLTPSKMASSSQPLTNLAPSCAVVSSEQTKVVAPVIATNSGGFCGSAIGGLLLWFFIIAVITWFILYMLKPEAIQKRNAAGVATGEVDWGRLLIASIIIALIIVLFIWLIRSANRC
jgi:hypothetical protein